MSQTGAETAPFPMLAWPAGVADHGTYTLADSITNVDVCTPDGNTPDEADLLTLRYRHHVKIAEQSGTVFVAFSLGGTNEDAGGQMVGLCYSTDAGATWSAPVLIVPAQSTFSGTGASYQTGTRICYPRNFTLYGGQLYLICGVDTVGGSSSGSNIGAALLARAVNTNGTVGDLFRISSATYAAIDGKTEVDYDGTLGPPLMADAKLYGTWGGSGTGQVQSEWLGFTRWRESNYVEPSTFPADDGGSTFYRLWRKQGIRVFLSYSDDGGITFSRPFETSIPNSPSSTCGLRLSDGRFAILGNPVDNGTNRDPLFLALTGVGSTDIEDVYAIRQGLSSSPTYAGTGKGGGASYVSAVEVDVSGTPYLYIAYSMQKETIGFSKLPIPGSVSGDPIVFAGTDGARADSQASPFTYDVTVPSGITDGYILVGVSCWDNDFPTAALGSATFDGSAMTALAGSGLSGDGGDYEVRLFGLAIGDKAAGDYTFSLALNETVLDVVSTAVIYNNVHQTTSVGTGVAAEDTGGASTTATVTATTATGEVVVDYLSTFTGTPSEGANQTVRGTTTGASDLQDGKMSEQAGADGGVMSWTVTAQEWQTTAVSLKPANP